MTDGNGTGTRPPWGTPHDILLFIVGSGLLAEEAIYQESPRWALLLVAMGLMGVPWARALLEIVVKAALRWLLRNGKS